MRILSFFLVLAALAVAGAMLGMRGAPSDSGVVDSAGAAGAQVASVTPQAVELPVLADSGQVVLSVDGPHGSVTFTRSELEALGAYRVRSNSFWPSDEGVYEGPLLADVLQRAGLHEVARIRLTGRDGFETTIPRADWTRWEVLLATRRDGAVQETATKGPVRIIYPFLADPVLRGPEYRLRWIWMIERIDEAAS